MLNRNEVTSGVVRELAAKYARKCWWVDQRDLIQEGWIEVLGNGDMADISDADYRRYVYSVVSRKLSRYLWSQSSPASDSRPGKHLAECQRAPLDAAPVETTEAPQMTRVARCKALRALVRRRVEHALATEAREARRTAATSQAGVQRVRKAHLDCVLMVVLDGKELAEAARARNVAHQTVQAAVNRLQERLKADTQIRKILAELRDELG